MKSYRRDHFSLLRLISLRHQGGNNFVKGDLVGLLHKNIDILRLIDQDGNTIIHHILQSSSMESYLKLQLLIFINDIVPECLKLRNREGMLPVC